MEFDADLKLLHKMLAFVVKEGQKVNIPKDQLGTMEVCCEEALVNIISYGNPSAKLNITCHSHKHRFEVTIKDKGTPFNPIESDIDPQFDIPIAEREIGGLGIYMIRTMLDESSYQRLNNENILRLTLRLDTAG